MATRQPSTEHDPLCGSKDEVPTGWKVRFSVLWQQLVPMSGPARTVQGEVIRIAGRIEYEWKNNRGVNWNDDFQGMADAWLLYVGSGISPSEQEVREAAMAVADLRDRIVNTDRICALAVDWVGLNPEPILLPTPRYAF